MAGFLIATAHVDVEANTAAAVRGILTLATKLTTLGPIAIAAGAVGAAALGGITAGAVAAGAAVGAFGLAAKPQLAEVANAAKLGEAAQKAMAAGAEDAAEKQKLYKDALAEMPPATRATAVAFVGLKGDFDKWSDSLAGTTMPVFTKGIGILRSMLPALTPLVKTAAGAFTDMLDGLDKGVTSGGFKKFMDELNTTAKQTLPHFIGIIKNVFMGFGGIIRAFLPEAANMTGGLEDMTAKFREWSEGLGQSQGFKTFMDYVKENGPLIGGTLKDVAVTLGNLIIALAPLAGVTLPILAFIAEQIAKIPPPILTGIAVAITAIKIAMMAWSAYLWLTSSALWPLITATWAWTAALLANPVTWIVIGVLALVAAIVLIATKTTWFQTAWNWAWSGIKAGVSAAINGIVAFLEMLGRFFTETIPRWATTAKDKVVGAWNSIFAKTKEIYSGIKTAIINFLIGIVSGIASRVSDAKSKVTGAWNSIKSTSSAVWSSIKSTITSMVTGAVNSVRTKISDAVNIVKGIKGKVTSALSGAGSFLKDAGRRIIQGLIDGVQGMIGSLKNKFSSITNMIPDWKGPMDVDLKLLAPSGQALMSGLMDGIGSSTPLLKRQLGDITSSIPTTMNMGINSSGLSKSAPTGFLGLGPAPAASGGVHIENLEIRIDGTFDISTPAERKQLAEAVVVEFSDTLRKHDKERY
ncbi:hypothetical protein ACFUN8_18555 [Streptomyces sp. NPDC057307]|uniref:phage tail protein n=1 Tax=Streptomyces sp. NPDC057307 TaxID=3346096 RepID=UPI00362FA92D